MTTYTGGPSKASTTPTRNARGYLGHKRPTWERADLAAKDYVQRRPIEAPTLQQLAFAYRVSVASIQCRLNGKGRNGNGNGHPETLTDHLLRASAQERREAASALGASVVWDEMIIPLIAADRAGQ